ncbi:hypothetical protein GBAR_LOCUS22446, partial [Geodia barretti]
YTALQKSRTVPGTRHLLKESLNEAEMEVRTVFQLVALLLLGICTRGVYGWKETFSEARIGDTLTLTVGTIKGSPEVRVILGVEYNNTEVSVDPTRFILAAEDLSLQVTVLDDGQPLQEDKNITLTLAKIAGGKSSDIIVTEAIIAVRSQNIPGL